MNRSGLQFPSSFQSRPSLGKLSAANSIAFRVSFRASQASDVTAEGILQSAESAIGFGRRLQRFEIAGLRAMWPCSILKTPWRENAKIRNNGLSFCGSSDKTFTTVLLLCSG